MSKPSEPLRVAVVGYGFGRFHVRTLANLTGVRLVAVADQQSDELESAAEQYGFKPYRDALTMFGNEQIDAVTLAVSPKYRKPLIEAAIGKGMGIFIEKPWASNREHAKELAEICATSIKPVMVGFSFRFHPAIVKLRQLLDTELGSPRMLAGQYVFSCHPPKDNWLWDPDNGNGFIHENSCHLFDAVCYLMGRPTCVYAEGGRFEDQPMEDAATITLRFENGSIAALTCGAIGTPVATDYPRIELFAEHGQARLNGEHHIWQSLDWAKHSDDSMHHFASFPEQLGMTRYTHAFEHFIDCMKNSRTPTATIDDGILSVDVAMAVVESIRTGRVIEF